jgi:hypothetical protein
MGNFEFSARLLLGPLATIVSKATFPALFRTSAPCPPSKALSGFGRATNTFYLPLGLYESSILRNEMVEMM